MTEQPVHTGRGVAMRTVFLVGVAVLLILPGSFIILALWSLGSRLIRTKLQEGDRDAELGND